MKKYQSLIPKWHVLETDKIIVCETSQPLISLPDDLNNIVYEPKYAQQNIPGAVSVCRMRKITFDMLNEASKLLPKGYAFKIFDAWRPVAVQKYLFNRYAEKLMFEKGIDFSFKANAELNNKAVKSNIITLFFRMPQIKANTSFLASISQPVYSPTIRLIILLKNMMLKCILSSIIPLKQALSRQNSESEIAI